MNFRTFTQTFNEYLPLSVLQIKLQQRDFDMQQLYLRERKGRLHSLIKGRRIHPKALQEIGIGAMIANNIYEPSYLSLQRALRYYNLIPEGVSQYTSCTTKKTQTHNIPAGSFVYRSIAPRYYR